MIWIQDCKGVLVNLDDVRKICIEEIDRGEPGSEQEEAVNSEYGESTHFLVAYSKTTSDDDQPDYVLSVGDEDYCSKEKLRIWQALPERIIR